MFNCLSCIFGLAFLIAAAVRVIILFAVLYMSPECMAGRASFPSDLWSLGLTALHLATGQVPWGHVRDDMGNAMNEGQLMFHISQRSNAHPLPNCLPAWLLRTLQGCLAYNPEDRATCQGLSEFLSSPQQYMDSTGSGTQTKPRRPPAVDTSASGSLLCSGEAFRLQSAHVATPRSGAVAAHPAPKSPAGLNMTPRFGGQVTPAPLSPKHSSFESWGRNAPPPPSGFPPNLRH